MDGKLNTAPKNVWGLENKVIKFVPYAGNGLKIPLRMTQYVVRPNVQKNIGSNSIAAACMMTQ